MAAPALKGWQTMSLPSLTSDNILSNSEHWMHYGRSTQKEKGKKINFTPSWHWLIVMRFEKHPFQSQWLCTDVMDNPSGNGSFTYVAHTHFVCTQDTGKNWLEKRSINRKYFACFSALGMWTLCCNGTHSLNVYRAAHASHMQPIPIL